ncbi:Starch-binding associating with outer membrane [Chitinophaga costaii]|uniref:Starch-binding associating with outer membrane n=1 Tax=Chitinophaga costaii TaxID=1335309 RepID=A0A1C4F6M3_9BACT|nr:RagB/SusD family nutrient uptake outer membrane protein [Chitinophaga costaii]SCC51442.1 Starch-binding associating with outer membrane [Chitinophaga costaii]
MKKIYWSLLLPAIVLTACKKDFLRQQSATAVNASTAINTVNDLADAVNGMYTASKNSSLFGVNVPVLGDLLADNIFISSSNYGQLTSDNNYTFIATSGEANGIWLQGYNTILQANRIIAAPIASTPTVDQLKGEAYAIRALTYLTLVNYFAKPNTISPDADGVPIITIPTYETGPYIKPARNSVKEVYDRVITDLDSAFLILPNTPIAANIHATNSNYISKYAAKAIEARAFLYRGDYANAQAAALLVVTQGGYTLTTTASAFKSFWTSATATDGKVETIFELNNNTTGAVSGLADFFSQAGNGEMLCTKELYDLYTPTDLRKGLIVNGIRKGNGQPAFLVNKYPNASNPDKDEIKIIRYAEVLLTLAESYARTGDETSARNYLNQLATVRDPSFTGYVSSGQQLLDDIVNERRKELAFEGLRLFDLYRLNQVIYRPAQPYSYPGYPEVSLTDIRRLQPIPQNEVDVNPNIKQNPGY